MMMHAILSIFFSINKQLYSNQGFLSNTKEESFNVIWLVEENTKLLYVKTDEEFLMFLLEIIKHCQSKTLLIWKCYLKKMTAKQERLTNNHSLLFLRAPLKLIFILAHFVPYPLSQAYLQSVDNSSTRWVSP